MTKKILITLLGIGIIGIIFAFIIKQSIIPRVVVNNQLIKNGQVSITEVDAVASSWLVIQTETNGVPGPVIGYTKIKKGSNKNVLVNIESEKSTPRLFAMIHEDTGEKDQFDFPNNDMPLLYNGDMVSQLFVVNK